MFGFLGFALKCVVCRREWEGINYYIELLLSTSSNVLFMCHTTCGSHLLYGGVNWNCLWAAEMIMGFFMLFIKKTFSVINWVLTPKKTSFFVGDICIVALLLKTLESCIFIDEEKETNYNIIRYIVIYHREILQTVKTMHNKLP